MGGQEGERIHRTRIRLHSVRACRLTYAYRPLINMLGGSIWLLALQRLSTLTLSSGMATAALVWRRQA